MVTRIGKLLIILFCAIAYSDINAIKIELKILSSDGIPLSFVPIGVPFEFQIEVQESRKRLFGPHVQGLENFRLLQASPSEKRAIVHAASSIDKKASLAQIFSYSLMAEKEGEFQLGPVTFNSDNKIKTKEIKIQVKSTGKTNKLIKKSDLECKFKLLKKKAFIGQKIPFKLECAFSDSNLYLKNIVSPNWSNARIGQVKNPVTDKKIKDSAVYNHVKVTGYLIPEKVGSLLLPGFRIDYLEEVKSQHFTGFLSIFRQLKHIYSNSEKLEVLGLPKTDKPVSGIGNFKNFNIKLDKHEIPMDSGVLVTLSVESNDDLDSIKAPTLNLPDKFKSYESKSSIINKEPFGIKNFEFIIQGLEEGTWQIPAQELTYFDTTDQIYKTLVTEPVQLKVLPGERREQKNRVIKTDESEPAAKIVTANDQIDYWLNKPNTLIKIPWFIFFSLVLLPVLFIIFDAIYKIWSSYREKCGFTILDKKVLNRLKKDIINLKKSDQIHLIYSKIKSGLSFYLTGNKFNLTEDEIINNFRNLKLNDGIISEFKLLISKLLLFTDFSVNIVSKEESEKVYDQTLKFIELLNINSRKITRKINKLALLVFIIFGVFNLYSSENKNDIANIIVALKRAQKFQPINQRIVIEKLIDQTKRKLNIPVKEIASNLTTFEYLYSSVFYVPLLIWQFIFLLLLLILTFFRNALLQYHKVILTIALAITGMIIIIFAYEDLTQYAIVNDKNVTVYLGPDNLYPVKNKLEYLDDLKVLKVYNSWYYISSKNINGWVEAKNIKLI